MLLSSEKIQCVLAPNLIHPRENIYPFYQRNLAIPPLRMTVQSRTYRWLLRVVLAKIPILVSNPPTSFTFQKRIQKFGVVGWWILRWSFLVTFSPLLRQEKPSLNERTFPWDLQMDQYMLMCSSFPQAPMSSQQGNWGDGSWSMHLRQTAQF